MSASIAGGEGALRAAILLGHEDLGYPDSLDNDTGSGFIKPESLPVSRRNGSSTYHSLPAGKAACMNVLREENAGSCQLCEDVSEAALELPGASPRLPSAATSGKESAVATDSDEDVSPRAAAETFTFYRNQAGGHFCFIKASQDMKAISIRPIRPNPKSTRINAQAVLLKPQDDREWSFYKLINEEYPRLLPHIPHVYGLRTLTASQVDRLVSQVDDIMAEGHGLAGSSSSSKPHEPLRFESGSSHQGARGRGLLEVPKEAHEPDDKKAKGEKSWEERMRSHHFKKYLVMEDLTHDMGTPRIMDLKMGYKQRSKTHTEKKRERCREKSLSSTSHAIGFRICGLHSAIGFQDKYWGRKLAVDGVQDALASYLNSPHASEEERIAFFDDLLHQLRCLRTTVERDLPHWRFWNTSLLFLYDGDNLRRKPDVRVIDFAHCTRVSSAEPDAEFVRGLMNVIAFVEAIRDGHDWGTWSSEVALTQRPPEEVQDAEEREPPYVVRAHSFMTSSAATLTRTLSHVADGVCCFAWLRKMLLRQAS
eukprot:TRINITY_DN13479_c0_g4_i2.p1 TRINITY_DN13479_c0_g4~~TRINITY_DN13479_c0_g4_i2.p1  ORF type:complete len:537 (-),score=81.38 TRINITY_DN13479_c0_g4_i2:171-1781(-)